MRKPAATGLVVCFAAVLVSFFAFFRALSSTSSPQCLHLIALARISSAQYGHVLVSGAGVSSLLVSGAGAGGWRVSLAGAGAECSADDPETPFLVTTGTPSSRRRAV